MPRLIDLTGKRFGRLTVLSLSYKKNHHHYWDCQCDCGNKKDVSGQQLKRGHTKSCGCYNKECLSNRALHGMSRKRLHNIWCGMKARCYNKNTKTYDKYGGRGISVCAEWMKDAKAFCKWAFANGYDDTKSIDRIDVNGDYSPKNCRWVTAKEQSRNTRQNHFVTISGKTMCLTDWANQHGISTQTAIKRLNRGWSIEEAVGLKQREKEIL